MIHPGTFELTRENEDLGTFLQMAELFEDAERDRVTLIRMGENFVKQKSILDLDAAIARGFRLQDEDRLYISSRFELGGGDKEITISGHAKQTGEYLLPRNLTLADVLFQYTGLTDPDFRALTYLKRGDIVRIDKTSGERVFVPFDLEAVLDGHKDLDLDLDLEANDEIVLYSKDRFREDKVVTIEGEVHLPGQYELKQGMNMVDLLAQAGGTTEAAHAAQAEVTRLVPGREPPLESSILPLNDHEMAAFDLQHQDIVYVRRIGFWSEPKVVTIHGEVKFAGKYILTEFDERLSHLVERCGGLSQDAFLEGVKYTRTWEGESRRVALDMEDALSGDSRHDIVLQGGDDIHIPPRNLAVNVQGQVTIPGIAQHLAGKNSGYYVDAMGGYLKNADVPNSHIIRANGLILKATRRFWFDPEVPPGSTLVVPEKAPGGPLWRHPRLQGIVVGVFASGLVWYGTN